MTVHAVGGWPQTQSHARRVHTRNQYESYVPDQTAHTAAVRPWQTIETAIAVLDSVRLQRSNTRVSKYCISQYTLVLLFVLNTSVSVQLQQNKTKRGYRLNHTNSTL